MTLTHYSPSRTIFSRVFPPPLRLIMHGPILEPSHDRFQIEVNSSGRRSIMWNRIFRNISVDGPRRDSKNFREFFDANQFLHSYLGSKDHG